MTWVETEIERFRRARHLQGVEARQRAALFLIGGVDLSAALGASDAERREMLRRLKRLVERERLKGARGHWSYDLNRHIALGQAVRRLSAAADDRRQTPRRAPGT